VADVDGSYKRKIHRIGIDSHHELVVFLREDSLLVSVEGVGAHARINVAVENGASIIATLNVINGDLVPKDHVGLSESAWQKLGAEEGTMAIISHAKPVDSFSYVRGKLFGKTIDHRQFDEIMCDISQGRYSDVQMAAFITACSGNSMNLNEIAGLTQAMVDVGEQLNWALPQVLDKHCVGGLPGNRTTPIVVPIVAACGLMMPKTSSRAITSAAGTADTLETMMPVDISLEKMREVIAKEGACMVWGGSVGLSPADDRLIYVENALEIDSDAQLVASVLSKKLAVGSSHVLIDMPIGPTAKIRTNVHAKQLEKQLISVGRMLGIKVAVIRTDGTQPVGRGIGPALEAHDVLAVLQGKEDAPEDLKNRSLQIAGSLIEMGGVRRKGEGFDYAKMVLESGKAWKKFQAIAEAQGGLRQPGVARYCYEYRADQVGSVVHIDNRFLSRLAKLVGAPTDSAAGVLMKVKIGEEVDRGDPLFSLFAESEGKLRYARDYLADHPAIIVIGPTFD